MMNNSESTDFCQRYGPWALVAGASDGLGAEFASHLADRGLNLVPVARREDKLRELCAKLSAEKGIQTHPVALDLSRPDVAARLAAATQTPNYQLSLADGHKSSVPAMSPSIVVAETLDALGKQPGVIPGFSNRLQAFIMRRLLPRRMAIRLMSRVLTGMFKAT